MIRDSEALIKDVILTAWSKGDGRLGFGFSASDARNLFARLRKRGQSEVTILMHKEQDRYVSTVKTVTKTFPTTCRHLTNTDTTNWIKKYGGRRYKVSIREEECIFIIVKGKI